MYNSAASRAADSAAAVRLSSISSSYEHAQRDQRESVSLHAFDAPSRSIGAYTADDRDAGRRPEPFFADSNMTLSRPAHMCDYQTDSAAFPMRTARPEEISPYVAVPLVVNPLPKMVFTSDAEQRWLLSRDQAARDVSLAAAASARVPDYSIAPPPFESKLGFRSAEEPAPSEPVNKEMFHCEGVAKELFWGGTGKFVSENGTSNSELYYRLARPLGGRLKSHYVSTTTNSGYQFNQYTDRP